MAVAPGYFCFTRRGLGGWLSLVCHCPHLQPGERRGGGVLVSPGWRVAAGLGEGGHPASGESQDAC